MTLNYIWVSFFLLAFIVALFKLIVFQDYDIFSRLVKATFDSSETAFTISLGLTGVLTLWLGLMRIAEKSGIIGVLTFLLGPLFKNLFPDIPLKHRAMMPIMMNFAANMLGLDNAATPLGLKAMQEMQKLNPEKDTATNAQIMFLVLNTSGLTLIPISVIMYRVQAGATHPSDVFIPILVATLCSTLGGLLIVSAYQKVNIFKPVVLAYILGIIGVIAGITLAFNRLPENRVTEISTLVSNFILFSTIVAFIVMAVVRKVNAYEYFIEGAKEGFQIAVKIIPFLVAMLVAIAVFRASGGMDLIIGGIRWFVNLFGLDTRFVDGLPTALMKPLSGSGARGMMVEAMDNFGADTFVGRMVCVLQGSTDTTLYVIAVYFGSVSIRNTRYAITCGLFADFVGIIAAIFISYLFFG